MSSWRRWTAFGLWAVVIFAAAPFANDLQDWISGRLGPRAVRLTLSISLLALAAALAAAVARRRGARAARKRSSGAAGIGARLAWLGGLAAATLLVMWRLEVEAEPAHLVLFGILGWLAFRALAVRHRDAGVYPAAAALTAVAGTLDEVLQWLLPQRFWDLGDVALNAAAGVLVQLVIWRVVRPPEIAPGFGARSLRLAARLAALEALLLLLCVSNTPTRTEWIAARVPGLDYLGQGRSTLMNEYGHLHADPEIGRFRSRLSAQELLDFDRRHGAEAARILDRYGELGYARLQEENPPSRAPFVYEAVGHLFYRQRYWGLARKAEDPEEQARLATAALRENLILERYFHRSLSLSSAALKPGARRWLERRHRPREAFESRASEWLVTAFSEAQARAFLLAALAALIAAERVCSRRLETGG